MKAPKKLGLAVAVAAALVLSACSSGTDSTATATAAAAPTPTSRSACTPTVTAAASGPWPRRVPSRPPRTSGSTSTTRSRTTTPQAQAQFIEAGVDAGCDGIAVSAPNPDAIQGAMDKANEAGIPLVTMNSGSDVFQQLHAFTHVGQDEFIAGQQAGKKFEELGATKILCPIQEANNIGLQDRCAGAADTFDNVENAPALGRARRPDQERG